MRNDLRDAAGGKNSGRLHPGEQPDVLARRRGRNLSVETLLLTSSRVCREEIDLLRLQHLLLLGVLILVSAGCGTGESPSDSPGPEWPCDLNGFTEPEEERDACPIETGWAWTLIPGGWACLPPHPPTPRSWDECVDAGGIPNRGIDGPYTFCSLPTTDAGTPCCGSSSCQGKCSTPDGSSIGERTVGMCTEWTFPECWRMVEDGIFREDSCQELAAGINAAVRLSPGW